MDFSDYKKGDKVVATADLKEDGENVSKGDTDIVESVSSDHHGGLQLNLIKNGRGWSNHIWRKPDPTEISANGVTGHFLYNPKNNQYFFRVYGEVNPETKRKEYVDYDIAAEAIKVTINDTSLSLIVSKENSRLDWSTEYLK